MYKHEWTATTKQHRLGKRYEFFTTPTTDRVVDELVALTEAYGPNITWAKNPDPNSRCVAWTERNPEWHFDNRENRIYVNAAGAALLDSIPSGNI